MAFTIKAEKRTLEGRATNHLRAEGKVPAIMYGFEVEPISITIDRNALERLNTDAGESSIIDLTVDGTTHHVLMQDIQRDPMTDFATHADFRRLDMTKKVETSIPITLSGEAPAVKELGGTLIQSLDEVEVEALPSALIREFIVNVESLKTFEDTIRVSDLVVPEGMEILTDVASAIAGVTPPRTQEEMDALDISVEVDLDAVEVTKEKTEEAAKTE